MKKKPTALDCLERKAAELLVELDHGEWVRLCGATVFICREGDRELSPDGECQLVKPFASTDLGKEQFKILREYFVKNTTLWGLSRDAIDMPDVSVITHDHERLGWCLEQI